MALKEYLRKAIQNFTVYLIFSAACNPKTENNRTGSATQDDSSPALINYKVVNAFPHDTTAYTEGFLFHHGLLYESTGHTEYLSKFTVYVWRREPLQWKH